MTGQLLRIFCHRCGGIKNLSVSAKEEVVSDPNEPYSRTENHFLAMCLGCDGITYAIESYTEDDWDPETKKFNSTWKTYPRDSNERSAFDVEHCLPPKVRLIYNEVIGAINAQLPVLAGIGLRALIEAICAERGAVGSNLGKRIDELARMGDLAPAQAAFLHEHRFLGNAAAHEIAAAQPGELFAALEIAENLLRTIYVLPMLLESLKIKRKGRVTDSDRSEP